MTKYYVGIQPEDNYQYFLHFFEENYPHLNWRVFDYNIISYMFFLFKHHLGIFNQLMVRIDHSNITHTIHILSVLFLTHQDEVIQFLFDNYIDVVSQKVLTMTDGHLDMSDELFDYIFDRLTNGPDMHPTQVFV